jgi:hypothetical protein
MDVVKILFVILTFLISFGLSGCSSNVEPSNKNYIEGNIEGNIEGAVEANVNVLAEQSEKTMMNDLEIKVKDELTHALLNKDFRLYATSGRRITFPGVLVEDTEFVNRYCGKKFMASTGDVIRSEEQKTLRKQSVEYAKKYNQLILEYCQKENN